MAARTYRQVAVVDLCQLLPALLLRLLNLALRLLQLQLSVQILLLGDCKSTYTALACHAAVRYTCQMSKAGLLNVAQLPWTRLDSMLPGPLTELYARHCHRHCHIRGLPTQCELRQTKSTIDLSGANQRRCRDFQFAVGCRQTVEHYAHL